MRKLCFAFGFGALFLVACQESGTPKLESNDAVKKVESSTPFDSINSLIKADPNDANLYFQRAKMHYDNRDIASSLSDVGRSLKIDSNRVDYYLLLADLKLLNKQSRESRDALLKAREIDPTNIEVLLNLGELYMVVQDADASFKYLNEALKIDIHNARAYRLKGFNYKFLRDTSNAVSSFQTAIEQDPNDYDSYIQLGFYYASVNHELAEDYFKNALLVRPTSLEALYALGLHYQEVQNARAALNTYDKIIDITGEYFNAYYNRGYVYLTQLEKYDSAAYEFGRAIEFGPEKYPEAHYNLGLSHEQMGDVEKARTIYERTLRIDPQFDLAARGLSRLERI